MEKWYRVFVSSTFEDLREERQEVMKALLRVNCIPCGMELFPAASEDQWTLIERVIDECDYYIVLVAGRYGSIDKSGMSYTEREYCYALGRNKHPIAFLHGAPDDLPARATDLDDERRNRLSAFRGLLKRQAPGFWETAAELGAAVAQGIVHLIRTHDAGGLIPPGSVPETVATPQIGSDGFVSNLVATSNHIALFRDVNHFCLQVLIRKFQLTRQPNGGVLLEVEIASDAPTIWGTHGKRAYWGALPGKERDEAIKTCQEDLDRFLIDGVGDTLPIERPPLLFRYASGGTLPILNIDGHRYYCLIYRDVHPIGWNIANGGCDTSDELLHPEEAMKRELSEELIIIDSKANKRLVFDETHDRPEFLMVRKLINVRFPHLKISECKEEPAKLTKNDGPDELEVHIEGQASRTTHKCYLNINAIDLGIEIDRSMEIKLDDYPSIIDGELSESVPGRPSLVNAPIGLFEVGKLQKRLRENPKGPSNFLPDKVFWGGTVQKDESTKYVVETLFHDSRQGHLSKKQVTEFGDEQYKYDLCPVTRNIIRRTAGC